MDKLLDKISGLSQFSIFRDFIILMMGFMALIILDLHYKPDISLVPNIKSSSHFDLSMSLVFLSYFVGRILLIVSDIWVSMVSSIFIDNKFKKVKKYMLSLRNYFNADPNFIDYEPGTYSYLECDVFLEKNKNIYFNHERNIVFGIFLSSLIGLSLLMSYIYSFYIIIFSLILTFLKFDESIKFNNFYLEVARYMLSQKDKNPKI